MSRLLIEKRLRTVGLTTTWLHSANDVLALEIIATGTKHSAQNSRSGAVSRKAFENLLDADQWMMFRNTKTGVVHWDFVSTLWPLIPAIFST